MAKTTTISLNWSTSGDEGGPTGGISVSVSGAAAEAVRVPIVAGRNNVFFPGPPTFTNVIVVSPAGSTNAKTWDAGATTGGPIGPAGPCWFTVPSGTTTINIGSVGSETLTIYFF